MAFFDTQRYRVLYKYRSCRLKHKVLLTSFFFELACVKCSFGGEQSLVKEGVVDEDVPAKLTRSVLINK